VTQALLFVGLHLVGMTVTFAIGPHRRPALCCAFGFPVGLAVLVLLALPCLLLGLPYPEVPAAAALVAGVAAAVVALRRGLPARARWLALAWTAGFAAACAGLTYFNLSVLTYDSHHFVLHGAVVAREGTIPGWMLTELSDWGVFQIVAQSTSALTMQDFLYSLPLVLGSSFAPLFALLLWHGIAAVAPDLRWRTAIAVLTTAALFTLNNFLLHVFYIHTNLAAAVYLTGAVALLWLCQVGKDPAGLPLAFLCLAAFALQRVETPAVALIFLALTLTRGELPRRTVTMLLAAWSLLLIGWYEFLAAHVPADSEFLTPTRCHIVAATVAGFFAWWLVAGTPIGRRIDRWVPVLVPAALALALGAAFFRDAGHMADSAWGLVHNYTGLPHWGFAWYAIAALVLLGLALPAPPLRWPFVVGIPAYFAFVLLLAIGRVPYYFYEGDSGNRMTLHVVPLIFFYFGLKAARACDRTAP
jgi:hypothetical protein